MSRLVTLDQAIELKKLGFDSDRFEFCFDVVGDMVEVGLNYEDNVGYKVFYIAEALEWFREVKGIECEVSMSFDVNISADEAELIGYGYVIYDTKSKKISYSGTFASREVAESALLDALIECMSK